MQTQTFLSAFVCRNPCRFEARSSAIAEAPSDALCPLKSCQLLHSCTKNSIHKGLRQVSDREGHSRSSELTLFSRLYVTSF